MEMLSLLGGASVLLIIRNATQKLHINVKKLISFNTVLRIIKSDLKRTAFIKCVSTEMGFGRRTTLSQMPNS
jgi:hypothetical protein